MWYSTVGCLTMLILSLLVAPLATQAQRPGKLPRIGYLHPGAASSPLIEAFRQGLHDLGYVEGHNLHIEYRFAEGQFERLPALAAELVQLPVEVLVTDGPGALAAQHATATIPIVFAVFAAPVEEGLVASLARPGGNVTGLSSRTGELAAKRLELLTEVVPGLSRIAILWNPSRPAYALQITELHAVSARVGIHVEVLEVRSPQEFDQAFRTMGDKEVGAVTVLDDALFFKERTRLATLAVQSQLPAIYGNRGFVEAGGLLSYGPNFSELFRRAATYVDKLLKGAKPADLPVEQPTKFELVINLKTAKALGFTIPPSILFQATEVIR
jgi:putative tryptophan/tyrosine transport system substrate-binding protein